jgi:hypothetical protein
MGDLPKILQILNDLTGLFWAICPKQAAAAVWFATRGIAKRAL